MTPWLLGGVVLGIVLAVVCAVALMQQPTLTSRARAVLAADPRFKDVIVDAHSLSPHTMLILRGRVKTANDRFDAHSAMFLKLNPPPKAVWNDILADDFHESLHLQSTRPSPFDQRQRASGTLAPTEERR